MPDAEDFTRIEALARSLQPGSVGHAYGPWLAARGAGLKDQAKAALGTFLNEALAWPEARRRNFVVWLDQIGEQLDVRRAITPHPLMTRLVLPTLRAWAEAEPADAMAHLLLARFHDWSLDDTSQLDHYRRALERDAGLVAARRGVIHGLCDMVERNQHHLPDDYLGDRERDAASMEEAASLAEGLPDATERQGLLAHTAMLRDRALSMRNDGGLATYFFER